MFGKTCLSLFMLKTRASLPVQNLNIHDITDVVTATDVIAPAPIWLTAPEFPELTGSAGPAAGKYYDPSFHEITYVWKLRGSPLGPFTAPQNMPAEWNDPNTAYGKSVAFCLSEPGTYIVDLEAIDVDGTIAFAKTQEIIVQSADDAFAPASTVYVALDGDFSGVPTGALTANSIAALTTHTNAATGPLRARFKRGETYPDFSFAIRYNRLSYADSWGDMSDGQPIIHGGFLLIADHVETQTTFANLDFRGNWDVLTNTGWVSSSPLSAVSSQVSNTTTVFWGCNAHGHDISFSQIVGANLSNCRMMIANCVADDFRTNSIYSQGTSDGSAIALIGSRISRDPQAMSHGGTSTLISRGGPVRLSDNTEAYIAMNDMFSNLGAFGLGDDVADASCLRLNTSCILDARYIVDRNVFEGGYVSVHSISSNPSRTEKPGNYLLDKNIVIATAGSTGVMMELGRGGTTVRNSYGYVPNVAFRYIGGQNFRRGLVVPTSNDSANSNGNLDEPFRVYNCTLLSEQSAAFESPTNTSQLELWKIVAERSGIVNPFTDVHEHNNVVHNPDSAKPSVGFAPADLTTLFSNITPRYAGKRWDFRQHSETRSSTIVTQGSDLLVAYADIDKILVDGTDLGGKTDQAYWLAIEATDTSHQFYCNGRPYSSDRGEFTVSYADATYVTVTNTSDRDWTFDTFELRLDRHTLVPAFDTSGATNNLVPMLKASSPAVPSHQAVDTYQSYDTIIGVPRSSPVLNGAF